MFDTVVDKLVKTIGADLYIPSASVGSAQNIVPLSLVERKASKWWLGNNKYYATEFLLSDVVDGDPPLKVVTKAEKDLVSYNKTATVKVNGSLSGHFKDLFTAELSNVDTITVKANLGELHSVEVSEQSLLDNLASRKLKLKHELLREMSGKKRRALCVVIGVVKTTTPTTIVATLNLDIKTDAKVSALSPSIAGGEVKGGVEDDRTRSIGLPAGTVLAYQVVELAISDKGDVRVMASKGSVGGYHAQVDKVDALHSAGAHPAATDALLQEEKEELDKYFKGFACLSSKTRKKLVEQILILCDNEESLLELSALLYAPGDSSDVAEIQEVLDTICEYRKNSAVTQSVQAVCRILRNLDTEGLSHLTCMPVSQLNILYEILETTHHGEELPFGTNLVLDLISTAPQALSFLLCGLDYTLSGQGLQPPDNPCDSLLGSAYAAAYGLYTCYNA